MSETHRKVSQISKELPTVSDLWKAVHGVKENTDLLVNFLLPNEKTGGKGKIAELEGDIKENSKFREKITKRNNIMLGGILVIQFIFGLIIIFVKS